MLSRVMSRAQILIQEYPSFLVTLLPPHDEAVKHFRDHLEIGLRGQTISEELLTEREALGKAVASLNTVRILRDGRARQCKSNRPGGGGGVHKVVV